MSGVPLRQPFHGRRGLLPKVWHEEAAGRPPSLSAPRIACLNRAFIKRLTEYICINLWIDRRICIIFVDEISARPWAPIGPDLLRFSGPIKIAQTLAGEWFWKFWTFKTDRFGSVNIN